MSVTVTVRNKDRLAAKFRALAPAAQKALADVNIKSAEEMVANAQNFVPVRTGLLRSTIHYEVVGGPTEAVRVLAGGAATTKRGRYNYDYALGMEFGTSQDRAQPYFLPSYRLVKRRHRNRATRAINSSARKVARR